MTLSKPLFFEHNFTVIYTLALTICQLTTDERYTYRLHIAIAEAETRAVSGAKGKKKQKVQKVARRYKGSSSRVKSPKGWGSYKELEALAASG